MVWGMIRTCFFLLEQNDNMVLDSDTTGKVLHKSSWNQLYLFQKPPLGGGLYLDLKNSIVAHTEEDSGVINKYIYMYIMRISAHGWFMRAILCYIIQILVRQRLH